MTRNQKIALGCGGAGCLGLIVIAIAAVLIFYFGYRESSYRAGRDYTFNVNINSNSNSDSNDNSPNLNSELEAESSDSSSSLSMSDDDQHKLFHAASVTGDAEIIRRVNVKLGLVNEDYTLGDKYQEFVGEHAGWVFENVDFIRSVSTPEKARAYVEEHFPD